MLEYRLAIGLIFVAAKLIKFRNSSKYFLFLFPLLEILRDQMTGKVKGGIYHRIQIDLTYNSNHIEGSKLTHDQTRYIFETNTIGITDESVNVDDIIETTNHFRPIEVYDCKVTANKNKKLSTNVES